MCKSNSVLYGSQITRPNSLVCDCQLEEALEAFQFRTAEAEWIRDPVVGTRVRWTRVRVKKKLKNLIFFEMPQIVQHIPVAAAQALPGSLHHCPDLFLPNATCKPELLLLSLHGFSSRSSCRCSHRKRFNIACRHPAPSPRHCSRVHHLHFHSLRYRLPSRFSNVLR